MNCEYVAKHYGVPACIGRRVVAYGKHGVIAEDRGRYIGVNLDSDKPGVISTYHPTDQVQYLGMGKVRRRTKSQERYQRYLEHSECFDSFKHFLAWDASFK